MKIFKFFKNSFKESGFVYQTASWLIYIYLKLAYSTSRWVFIFPSGYSRENFINEQSSIFALWHNTLSYSPQIFAGHQNSYGLVSPHSDGKIIGDIICKFGFQIISGSSNKDSAFAVKSIITKLKNLQNVVITPDGPRGPQLQINSNITEIAKKYAKKLIPITCKPSNAFILNSWDKMMIPIPFSRIVIKIHDPITLSGDKTKNDLLLQTTLSS